MRPPSPPPHPSESALDAALAGFTDLVRRVAWRHRLSDADVDEVMQEVRIRLWKASSGGESPSEQVFRSPASYVYRTAASAAIDLIRRRRSGHARNTVSLEGEMHVADDAPTAQAELEGAELAEQVERAIESIPASRRAAVRMYLRGYSREDIADLMSWSEAKTRNLVYRGLDDLRRRRPATIVPPEGREAAPPPADRPPP
jgi:RNA polymerase sigma-70 factor (ECF subfamily)